MEKPIRVLQCFGTMGRGGAETLIMNIYRNVDREKIQFDFVVHREKDAAYDEEIYDLGGKIYKIPKYRLSNHFEYKKAWHELFNNHDKWPIIHGHMYTTAAIYLKIAKKYGLITIAHSHNTSTGVGLTAIIKKLLQYPIKYNADFYFACSEAAGLWLYGENICKKDTFFILNNAIETKKFVYDEEIRNKKRTELSVKDKFVIGHIGSFMTQKNHKFLIELFEKVHSKNNNTALLLIGDGGLRLAIEEKVKNLGLSNKVIFTGFRSDIPDLLQAMDVFVFPSLYEGLGIVAVEAQATGLHCVVSDSVPKEAYITDLIEKASLKDSADAWADKILKYANGYERFDTSKQIRKKGYDISETAKWLENFYLYEHKLLSLDQ